MAEAAEAKKEQIKVGGLGGIGPRWTYDHTFEKPAGTKDMGGWTAGVYTAEQQKRLAIDELGNPVKKSRKVEKKPLQGRGPRWTWDPSFPKPKGEKDMGGWTASVYTEEQQKELSCDEMGAPVENEQEEAKRDEEPRKLAACGPRWTWDDNFEKPKVRKDMGTWTATVYSAEQQQRLGIDEMGVPNRLTKKAFVEKIYGVLCRKTLVAQYKAYKAEFKTVFGEDLKELDIMKGDVNFDKVMNKDEFIAWARIQDRAHEGIERPWEMTAGQLADVIFKGCTNPAGLTKKEFVALYTANQRAFQFVFKVASIKWGDFRKGDIDHDKHLSRDEFLKWAAAQTDDKKVQVAKADAKVESAKVDSASEAEVLALVEKVFGRFNREAMKAQHEYFTNDFKEQFGEELKNLDFMKGDANYDRVTTKAEFLDWVTAQNKDKAGIERPWEMSAEQLADIIFDGKPNGLSAKEFSDAYTEREQTFDTLLKGKVMFSDFRKGDADHSRKLIRDEFMKFVTAKQAESLQNKE